MPALRAGGGSRPRPLGASRARPQFRRRALGPCPLCGSRPLSAPRAAGARGCAACGRVCHIANHPTRPRQAACGGPCLMICAVAQRKQGRCIALIHKVSGDNKSPSPVISNPERGFCASTMQVQIECRKTVSTVRRQSAWCWGGKDAWRGPVGRLRRRTNRDGRHPRERS